MMPSDAGVRSLGWMAQGACQSEDPEQFFPIAASRADLPRTRAAKAICQGCAVRAQCLSYGLATRQDGIWGEPPRKSAAPSGSQPTCRGAAPPARARSPISPDDAEEAMRIGTILLVIWLVIGAVAAGQRHYFGSSDTSCAKAGTIAVTIAAGPLNYIGVNPKISCKTPHPSK